MQLQELLEENRGTIIAKWLDFTLAEFHKDATRFFKSQKDQFANPIGFNTKDSLERLFDILCRGDELSHATEVLADYARMRAIQGLKPSEAVTFIFALKKIVRTHCLAKEPSALDNQVAELESRIDQLALVIFDHYLESRERLYQVRIDEIKRGTHILTEGAVCPSALMRQNIEQQ